MRGGEFGPKGVKDLEAEGDLLVLGGDEKEEVGCIEGCEGDRGVRQGIGRREGKHDRFPRDTDAVEVGEA